jgi:hypothetical protein
MAWDSSASNPRRAITKQKRRRDYCSLSVPENAPNDEAPQTTLVAEVPDDAPHTTLKPLVTLLPHTTDVPHTTELPETFVPQTTE